MGVNILPIIIVFVLVTVILFTQLNKNVLESELANLSVADSKVFNHALVKPGSSKVLRGEDKQSKPEEQQEQVDTPQTQQPAEPANNKHQYSPEYEEYEGIYAPMLFKTSYKMNYRYNEQSPMQRTYRDMGTKYSAVLHDTLDLGQAKIFPIDKLEWVYTPYM